MIPSGRRTRRMVFGMGLIDVSETFSDAYSDLVNWIKSITSVLWNDGHRQRLLLEGQIPSTAIVRQEPHGLQEEHQAIQQGELTYLALFGVNAEGLTVQMLIALDNFLGEQYEETLRALHAANLSPSRFLGVFVSTYEARELLSVWRTQPDQYCPFTPEQIMHLVGSTTPRTNHDAHQIVARAEAVVERFNNPSLARAHGNVLDTMPLVNPPRSAVAVNSALHGAQDVSMKLVSSPRRAATKVRTTTFSARQNTHHAADQVNPPHHQIKVNQLFSKTRSALKAANSALSRVQLTRYKGSVVELDGLFKELNAAEKTREQQERLKMLKREFGDLKKQSTIVIHRADEQAAALDRNTPSQSGRLSQLARNFQQYFIMSDDTAEMDVGNFDAARDAYQQLQSHRQTYPHARLSTFDMRRLAAAQQAMQQALSIEREYQHAQEEIHAASPQAVTTHLLGGLLGLQGHVFASRQDNVAYLSDRDTASVVAFQHRLNTQLVAAMGHSSALVVQQSQLLVSALSENRQMLVGQFTETGMPVEEANARVEQAIEQLVQEVVIPLLTGDGQFIYTLHANSQRQLVLTTVSIHDFMHDPVVARNLLLVHMMMPKASSQNRLWGIASSEQLAALDVVISYQLLTADDAQLALHVPMIMQSSTRLARGDMDASDMLALINPAAQALIGAQHADVLTALQQASHKYQQMLPNAQEPLSLNGVVAVLRGFSTMFLTARNVAASTRYREPSRQTFMAPFIRLPVRKLPSIITPLPPVVEPVAEDDEDSNEPVEYVKTKQIPRPLVDKTSPLLLLRKAQVRVDDELIKIAALIADTYDLQHHRAIRREHKQVIATLTMSLGKHLTDFVNDQGDKQFMQCKTAMLADIKQAEKAFSNESGVWRNYVMPLVNTMISSLKTIMTMIYIPESYQPTLFKAKPTHAAIEWEKLELESKLNTIFEQRDLLTDIQFVQTNQCRGA